MRLPAYELVLPDFIFDRIDRTNQLQALLNGLRLRRVRLEDRPRAWVQHCAWVSLSFSHRCSRDDGAVR